MKQILKESLIEMITKGEISIRLSPLPSGVFELRVYGDGVLLSTSSIHIQPQQIDVA